MLDLKFIRENAETVQRGAEAKGMVIDIPTILSLDEQRRKLIQEGETLKAKRNEVSAQIGKAKKSGGDASEAIAEMEAVKNRIQTLDADLRATETKLNELLLTVPNVPHPSVPFGKTPEDNKEVFRWGELPVVDFPLKPHWEITDRLGIIDFTRGAKVTGAGFPFYVGRGATLERSLINFFIDQAIQRRYKEIQPPIVVNEDSARGTSLHSRKAQAYMMLSMTASVSATLAMPSFGAPTLEKTPARPQNSTVVEASKNQSSIVSSPAGLAPLETPSRRFVLKFLEVSDS